MTPKEKAIALVERFMIDAMFFVTNARNKHKCAKQCSLITADEMIKEWSDEMIGVTDEKVMIRIKFKKMWWQQVKQEIEKL